MQIRLSEAQSLHDAINDPSVRPALEAFRQDEMQLHMVALLRAVRMPVRDTMKEARLAGKVEAYEEMMEQLQAFSSGQMMKATQ